MKMISIIIYKGKVQKLRQRVMTTIHKTMSFAIIHFSVAFTLAYLMTGSWLVGGALALIEPAVNTFAFHLHEKAWAFMQTRKSKTRSITT